MAQNTQLCIGAYIEAAVYARALINMKFIKRKSKAHEIIGEIKNLLATRIIFLCYVCTQEELLCAFIGYSIPITYSMLIKPVIGRNFKIFAWHLV